MTIPIKNLETFKGQHKNFTMSVAGSSGVVDVTNDTISFYVKETVDGDAVITKTTADTTEIEKTDPTKGKIKVKLLPADTENLTSGKFYYQLWRLDASNSELRPILMGYFWVEEVAPTLTGMVRQILGEAGELRMQHVSDEIVSPASLVEIHTTRIRIQSVEGVWLLTDETHSGTNYYTGGGFVAEKGKIWLGTALPTMNQLVRLSYTWESGVTDETISWHLHSSKLFVTNFTGYVFEYGAETDATLQGAEAMAVARTVIGCVLTVNGANVAQMGYNFRLDEFEIQTKLWGEGMIAEALFNLYRANYEEWKQSLGKAGHIFVTTATVPKYNIETLVGYYGNNSEGSE